jgi:hypothetical protein
MSGKDYWELAALVLSAILLLPAAASAGPFFGCSSEKGKHCPTGSYSPFHYWTPHLYRLYVCVHGPVPQSLIAQDRHPGLPTGFQVNPYPCRSGVATFYDANGHSPTLAPVAVTPEQ